MAINDARQTGPYAESAIVEQTELEQQRGRGRATAILGAGAALAAGALIWGWRKRTPYEH